jgi:hypothetical protein
MFMVKEKKLRKTLGETQSRQKADMRFTPSCGESAAGDRCPRVSYIIDLAN